MKQQNLPMLIPITRKLTKAEKKEKAQERYDEIMYSQNVEYWETQWKELARLLNG